MKEIYAFDKATASQLFAMAKGSSATTEKRRQPENETNTYNSTFHARLVSLISETPVHRWQAEQVIVKDDHTVMAVTGGYAWTTELPLYVMAPKAQANDIVEAVFADGRWFGVGMCSPVWGDVHIVGNQLKQRKWVRQGDGSWLEEAVDITSNPCV